MEPTRAELEQLRATLAQRAPAPQGALQGMPMQGMPPQGMPMQGMPPRGVAGGQGQGAMQGMPQGQLSPDQQAQMKKMIMEKVSTMSPNSKARFAQALKDKMMQDRELG